MLNLNLNILGRLNSGGGATPFDSPMPLRVASLDTTSITGWLTKVGADSYNWYLYDAAGTTLIDSDVASASATKTFSGLTVGTTYTMKASANKTGFAESPLVSQQIKTFPRMPIFNYQFMGLPDSDADDATPSNEFGVLENYFRVDKIRSVVNTNSSLDLNTTTATSNNKGSIKCGNLLPYQYLLPNSGSYYAPSSPIVISGDCTIGFSFVPLSSAYTYILSSSDNKFIVRKENNTINMYVGRGGTFQVVTYPTEIVNNKVNYVLLKFIGTSVYCGIFNPDARTTAWSSAVTGAGTADINLDTFFAAYTGSSVAVVPFYSLFAFSGAASDEEIQRSFQYFQMPDYTLQAKHGSSALTLKGTVWNALPSDGEIAISDLDNAGLTLNIRGWRIPSIGDKAAILLKQTLATHYNDKLMFYDFAANKYSDTIDLPYFGTVDNDHNTGSVSEVDNTLLVTELYRHYSDALPQNVYLRWFGDKFNMTEYTDGVQGAGKIKISGTNTTGKQYQSIHQIGNLIVIIVQERDGGAARWLGMLVSRDRGNFFEYHRLFQQDVGNWLYPNNVYVEDSTIRLIVDRLTFTGPVFYPKQYYATVNPYTKVVSNITASYSKDVSASDPLTIAELDSNAFEMTDGVFTFLGNERRCLCRPHWDGTTLKVLGGNGDETGFVIYEGTTSGWTLTQLDFGSNPVVFLTANTDDAINNGIAIIGDRIFVKETLSGKLQIVEYTKNGTWGAALTRVGVLTPDGSYDYVRTMVTPNTDYNPNHLLAAIKKDGGGAGVGKLFIKKLS